jgi:TRAP-type mannitol/chloroaromatic compound transport system permease small subunit
MPKRLRVVKAIDKLSTITGKFTGFGVPLLGIIVLYEVIMRYVFNSPTIWVFDISQFLMGAIYFLGAAYTLMRNKHSNMDMIYVRLSAKGKAVIDVITGVLALTFLAVLVWQSGLMAYESVLFNETFTQSAFEPPLYPIKIIFFIGCVLFLLQFLANFMNNLAIIFGKVSGSPE